MFSSILSEGIAIQPTTNQNRYFENDYVTIGYNPYINALILKYKRVGSEGEFFNANLQLLEIYEDIKSGKFHADLRNIGMVSIRGQQWVGEYVLPKLVEMSPLKMMYHSQHINDELFNDLVAAKIKQISEPQANAKGKLVVKQFKKEKDAKLWLANRITLIPN
jgi:hypothetical protein